MNQNNGNKIKENKYKILRMSLLLGNGENREETINNFEDAAREIDAMNDEVYLKDLDSKFYDTVKLEEEEKKLTNLVDYIGGRVDQRISLLNDFVNVAGYELVNLPTIKYEDKLDEYKSRLGYIKEYLSNTDNISKLNEEVSVLENKLNDSYVKKAKAEERNRKAEEELFNRFKIIVNSLDTFKDINKDNIDLKLNEVISVTEDSKKSLDIFDKSFDTLLQAGIGDVEKQEYLSYVESAREAYYNNKEEEYLLRIYVLLSQINSEYNDVLVKRNTLNDIIYERSKLREDLEVSGNDVLSSIYDLIDRQYDDIKSQSNNIENIDNYNNEINLKKAEISGLEQDNQKVEILSLLREFCIIDTYDNDVNDNVDNNNLDLTSNTPITDNNNLEINNDNLDNMFANSEEFNEEESNNEEVSDENINSNDIEEEINDNSNVDNINNLEVNTEDNNEEIVEDEEVLDNQVVSVEDATNIDLKDAIEKSNSVMKRVGDMLGVKVEEKKEEVVDTDTSIEPETPEMPEISEEPEVSAEQETPAEPEVPKVQETPEIPDLFDNNSDNTEESNDNVDNDNSEDINNIFDNNNFDADPETNNIDNTNNNTSMDNPLLNGLANTTLDEVMAQNNVDISNDNNDFWYSNEDTPMDLNSFPDLSSTDATGSDDTIDNTNNPFFDTGDTNNGTPSLDFPDLDKNGIEEEVGK